MEVPPKNTTSTATAEFMQSADGKVLKYKVSVININGVTVVHLHQGKTGETGPIVATLNRFNSPTFPIANATLTEGNLTSSKLYGPLINKQIPDLVKMINDGDVYVNIHTLQNPTGEIRGQLSLLR